MDAATVNVGLRLTETARLNPEGIGVVEPLGHDAGGKRIYRQLSFAELDEDTNRIAAGLRTMCVKPGTRLALVVRPGIDFISLVFGLFKAGVVTILIDPGMGRSNLIRCLEEAEPEGFVAIPLAHAVRKLLPHRFRKARFNVTVGRRWFWGGPTLRQLRQTSLDGFQPAKTYAGDPAAIIFTTGSTGPPKGVLYRHGNFNRQVDEIRDFYDIQPGEIDVPGFPLFALFNAAMGVTTVVPDMDFTRPADVDPKDIVEAVHDWNATQAFGSPALWNTVSRYCEDTGTKLPTLRRALSAGAPVPPHVLQRMKDVIHPYGDLHTPYGATESLPIASIAASTVLRETAKLSREGKGTCVGSRFPGMQWKIARISDEPIEHINDIEQLPAGEIGELLVCGEVVTREYVTRTDTNALHKVRDGEKVWHRMGDVGYLDEQDRFWFCGRKAHRVETASGTMFTIPCEAIINNHEKIYRSALVGLGPKGQQRPVIIAETWPEHRPADEAESQRLISELLELARSSPLTQQVETILLHPSLPVDIRHNAKIFREQLAVWAAKLPIVAST
ncbi:MAG: peptide synthase [Planctomycetaceae bacterium]|nr:peptide synthase [Planctomycetaceae bacterium]